MTHSEHANQIIELLLSKIEKKHQELGRFYVHDEYDKIDSRIVFWAIRDKLRDLKETTITNLEDFSEIEIKLTFSPRNFFEDVLQGQNVPYWQVATVMRILQSSDIVYDPLGKLEDWVSQAKYVQWKPETIELKKKTTIMLLERVKNRVQEDMIADAYIWMIKAAEEAICVPIMEKNAFGLGTAPLLLDTLRNTEINLYDFFNQLLGIQNFDPKKLENARKELEILADRLYQKNLRTDREMWILAAFVSINESERRLQQSLSVPVVDPSSSITSRLFETAVGELWQAYFLVAQNPRIEIKLDPWVVGSFWNWFGNSEIDKDWLKRKEEYIRGIINR
ncbi:MAG: hypothetical protein ACXACP_05765 [Candidatus Hodarchaeales archaeon]